MGNVLLADHKMPSWAYWSVSSQCALLMLTTFEIFFILWYFKSANKEEHSCQYCSWNFPYLCQLLISPLYPSNSLHGLQGSQFWLCSGFLFIMLLSDTAQSLNPPTNFCTYIRILVLSVITLSIPEGNLDASHANHIYI